MRKPSGDHCGSRSLPLRSTILDIFSAATSTMKMSAPSDPTSDFSSGDHDTSLRDVSPVGISCTALCATSMISNAVESPTMPSLLGERKRVLPKSLDRRLARMASLLLSGDQAKL